MFVVKLRLFHATLPVGVAEKFQDRIEWLFGILHDIRKCSALRTLAEYFARDSDALHTYEFLRAVVQTRWTPGNRESET